MVLRALFVLFISSVAFSFHIEEITGPDSHSANPLVRRFSMHHSKADGVDEVHFGECDSLESTCLPDHPSYVLKRRISYDEYLNRLADQFEVDRLGLKNDERQEKNYLSLRGLLQSTMNDENQPEDARKNARSKFDVLTRQGGIMDRFTRAVAIKRALEWDTTNASKNRVVFERSQVQYRQSIYPMNFVQDIQSTAELELYEPSENQQWAFVGNGLTRKEADLACNAKGNGYALPSSVQIGRAQAWLLESSIGKALAGSQPAPSKKLVWLNFVEASTIAKEVDRDEFPGRYKIRKYFWKVFFFAHALSESYYENLGESEWYHSSTAVETTIESSSDSYYNDKVTRPGDTTLVENFGDKTIRHSGLCVRQLDSF